MDARREQFWFLVRDAAKKQRNAKSQALALWLVSDAGDIPLNECQYPTGGISLRDTSKELKQRGYINKNGRAYHENSINEMIDAAFPVAAAQVLGVKLTNETYDALKSTFMEFRRQKRRYRHDDEEPTDEQICERSWTTNRRLNRKCKRQRPWDLPNNPEDGETDELEVFDPHAEEQDEDEAA